MNRLSVVAGIVVLLLSLPSHGDAGMIPFTPGVRLFEPNQRAVIAWNGEEEILILSTDTYASEPTKVLEVLPLRTEPTVKKADPAIFEKATKLINSLYRSGRGRAAGAAPKSSLAMPPPAGEVTHHEQIGRHDISVTHVLDVDGFCTWAEDYLRSNGAHAPQVPEAIRFAVQGYLEKGFTWIVYDVVELGKTLQSNQPVQYRFKSDCVFYPLVITQTESEKVNIQILILTPNYLTQFPELSREQIRVGTEVPFGAQNIAEQMVVLTRSQINDLSPDIDNLFGRRDGIMLRIWTLIPERRGRFRHDLVAR